MRDSYNWVFLIRTLLGLQYSIITVILPYTTEIDARYLDPIRAYGSGQEEKTAMHLEPPPIGTADTNNWPPELEGWRSGSNWPMGGKPMSDRMSQTPRSWGIGTNMLHNPAWHDRCMA